MPSSRAAKNRQFDYERAATILSGEFSEAETAVRESRPLDVTQDAIDAIKRMFTSATQSLREEAIGCALARIVDPSLDVRLPYTKQGTRSFNGRTLDEQVVNPFLQHRKVPCTKGPYLAVLRRQVKFVPETAKGLRDREGFEAMLVFLDHLEAADADRARSLLRALLVHFAILREAAQITVEKPLRLALEQHARMIDELLQVRSGGRIPVLLVAATLHAIRRCHDLPWDISTQGINVADHAAKAGGDIVVRRGDSVVLTIEVTERTVDRARLEATFNTKIAPRGLDDYLFLHVSTPDDEARAEARKYFPSGHHVGFLPVREWIVSNLATLGAACRAGFNEEAVRCFENPDVPNGVKLAWNEILGKVRAS